MYEQKEINLDLNPIEFDFSDIDRNPPADLLVWKTDSRNHYVTKESDCYRSLLLVSKDESGAKLAAEIHYYHKGIGEFREEIICEFLAKDMKGSGQYSLINGRHRKAEYIAYSRALQDLGVLKKGHGKGGDYRGYEPDYAFIQSLAEFLQLENYKILSIMNNIIP